MPILNMVYGGGGGGGGGGWQPGANTVAYYTLNGDINDHSGNGYNMLSRTGTISYGTLSNGNKYGIFDGNTIVSMTSNKPTVNTGTILMRLYYSSTSGVAFSDNENTNNNNSYNYISNYVSNGYNPLYGPSVLTNWTTTSPGTGQWFLYCLVQEGNNLIYYKNGVSIDNRTSSAFLNRGNAWNIGGLARGTQYYDKMNGYISNIIIENKVRTATEIADYYNLTKANYGL